MDNYGRYVTIFKESFQFTGEVESLAYQSITEWDSVGHMQLLSALESEFSIEMDVDDIIDFSSFKKGIDILKKYQVYIS
jgi:acyl carrier protein